MYQTNSVYVKLVHDDVSDIYDLKSVFMGPLKAVSVWHCAATTAPRSYCPNSYAEQNHKDNVRSSAVGKQLKQKKSNSLSL